VTFKKGIDWFLFPEKGGRLFFTLFDQAQVPFFLLYGRYIIAIKWGWATGEIVFCLCHASRSMLGMSILSFEILSRLKLAFDIDIPFGLYVNLLESCEAIDQAGVRSWVYSPFLEVQDRRGFMSWA
jgi:hypothetical protein